MINYYFKFKKNPDRKTRFDLIAYSLPAYDNIFFNPLVKPFIYAGKNPNINSKVRKSDLQISCNGKNLSSVYLLDLENPYYAYGDINNTNDLIIFIIEKDIIEMFILNDYKNFYSMIIDILKDSELNLDMEYFQKNAVAFCL